MKELDPNLAIIVIGLICGALVLVIGYVQRTHKGALVDILGSFVEPLLAAQGRADVALAPYGDALAPLNDGLEFLRGLTDEPSDWFINSVSQATGRTKEEIVEFLQPIVQTGIELTDGVAKE